MKRIRWRGNAKKIKCGVYYGKVRHTVRWGGKQLAVVEFDGEGVWRVPFGELEFVKE